MNKKSLTIGIVLIIASIVSALISFEIVPAGTIMYLSAFGFLAVYFFYKRILGFIIAGSVSAAISIFIALRLENIDQYDGGSYMMFLLSGAFLAVFLIHTLHRKNCSWGAKYWPLFPSIGLTFIGSLILVQQNLWNFDSRYLNLVNPLILLIVAAVVLYGSTRKPAGK